MRYLDTRTLERMGTRPQVARRRRFTWLVWVQPHFPNGTPRFALRTRLKWPVYLQHGGAA